MNRLASICSRDDSWSTIYANLSTKEVTTEFICFQHTWAVWVPCVILQISVVVSMACAHQSIKSCKPLPWMPLMIRKLMIGVTLVILGIIWTYWSYMKSKHWNIVTLKAATLSTTWATLLVVMTLCRYRGIKSSGLVFTTWTILAILSFIRLWVDLLALRSGRIRCSCILILSVLCTSLVTVEVILHCWADQGQRRYRNIWPELNASFLNKITFHWISSLVWMAWRRPLNLSDLWDLNLQRRAEYKAKQWEAFWQPAFERYVISQNSAAPPNTDSGAVRFVGKGPKETKPSVLYGLFLCTKDVWLPAITCRFVADLLVFLNPFLLKKLVAFVKLSAKERSITIGVLYALSLLGVSILISILNGQVFYGTLATTIQSNNILTTALYKKVLWLSSSERKYWDSGKVSNVMSIDVSRLTKSVHIMSTIIPVPIVISISVYFLWQELGPSLFAGVLVMMLIIPTQGVFIASRMRSAQIDQMRAKDSRMKLTSQIVQNVKVLKLYAWEEHFKKRLLEFRSKESETLYCLAVWQGISAALMQTMSFLIAAVTFSVYFVSTGHAQLTAEKVFVSLTLFNIMKGPMIVLSQTISAVMTASISYNRIKNLLCAEELKDASKRNPQLPQLNGTEFSIILDHASFSWGAETEKTAVLNSVDLRVRRGSIVAVTGGVGSGKSSLLCAISGDLALISGFSDVRGTLGVVSEVAWIQNLTIRDNILFGAPYGNIRYSQVIDMCALRNDIDQMPAGDLTEIGERGVTLSGGQKQRIALARAVYQDADVYLLDNPLSALDANVAQQIFVNVISNSGLLRNKTRLFVTHQRQFLSKCDGIIVMRDGRIFADEVVVDCESEESKSEDEDTKGKKESTRFNGSPAFNSVWTNGKVDDDRTGKLVKQEAARVGTTPWDIYKSSAKAMGLTVACLLPFFYLIAEGFSVGANFWLKHWVDGNRKNLESPNLTNSAAEGTGLALRVYFALGASQGASYFLAAFLTAVASVKAANTLHSRLLGHLLRSPLRFFETTPAGRIISRFSTDLDAVDSFMQLSLRMLLQSLLGVLGVLTVLCTTNPWFIIVAISMGTGYIFLQRVSMHASRQLKRLEAITISPIYVHFLEAVHGYRCIRCFGAVSRFVSDCFARVDAASRAQYASLCFERWLLQRLELASGFIVFFASLFAVLSKTVTPGSAALSITYAISVSTLLQQVIRYATFVENVMISIERISDYSTGKEEAWSGIQSEDTLPVGWPISGTVQFKNYHMNYNRDSQAALKNINLTVSDAEKLGIVGRTGAGKSSLLLAMLRIIEPTQGTVFIDNIDVRTIDLKVLRSRITIIPQDAVIFSGTFRMNLDPAEEYSDAEIWSALSQSALSDFIAGMPGKLSYVLSDGGTEMSLGQKHLLCLARALLRKSKILLLDEATAAVDVETDALILKAIHERFASSTVITIAHRLSTVLNSSRVLVMDDGEVLECGKPAELLSDPQSAFSDMCTQDNKQKQE